MTDPDERLRRLYGTLPREEPPAALDAAVLAAARRAVAPPSLARRWGAPVAVAATLVLVVGVTLEMQREEPGIETSIAPSAPPPAAVPEAAAPQAAAPAEPAPAPKPPAKTRAKSAVKAMPRPQLREPAPAPAARAQEAPRAAQDAPQAPSAPPAREAAPEAKRTAPFADALESTAVPRASPPAPAARSASGGVAANLSLQKRAVAEAPEAELERIAKLRAEGKDADADRALEAFRREHPGYRIDDAMWERVRPRER